jgi:heptosyltransferase-1
MGDILHALPAVTALRQAHPEWVIDWVVEPRWRGLLAASAQPDQPDLASTPNPARPIVDRIHLAPTKDWRQRLLSAATILGIRELRGALKAGRYDAVLDLQGAVRSAVVGRLAGSPRLIGEENPRERAVRRLYTERVATVGAHVIEQDVELASAVAPDALTTVEPWLPVDPAAETWCDSLLGIRAEPIALMNPGAGWGAKRWPAERYAAVAAGLIKRGLRVLVNAGPGEEPLAEVIAQHTDGAAAPLVCTLDQLIALTRRVALVVAGDTGPLHLACALGRPVVGIYGPTDPSRNGPFGTRFKVLRSPGSRRDHSRRAAPEAGLLTIMPADVLRAADELLQPVTPTPETMAQ